VPPGTGTGRVELPRHAAKNPTTETTRAPRSPKAARGLLPKPKN
jgi:hypothetical protein